MERIKCPIIKKDRRTESLFKELFPFGGKLNTSNRWFKLHVLVPWEELEEIYQKYFSARGRPGKDSQLINGLMLVKHAMTMSDEEVVEYFLENPYVQYFCGYDNFVTTEVIESSTLTRVRKRLGVEYFKKFELEVLTLLRERKIIKTAEQMIDATVYPSNITYPTDTKVIESARRWLVGTIKKLEKIEGLKKIRTYCRRAKECYNNFQRKRRHTKREIRRVKRQMLQYVRRNIGQLKGVLEQVKILGKKEVQKFRERLEVAEKIYRQQLEMHKKKTHSVKERIVSFHRPKVRPLVRGKSGKEVEFGPKASLSFVDGYLLLDKFSYEPYNEGVVLTDEVALHKERFGRDPEVVITDRIYGNRKNREFLERSDIKASIIPLGRKSKESRDTEKWVKMKQRIRNRIEGFIGVSKEHYGLARLLYKDEELNIRLGLLALNLSTAIARI